MTDTRRPALPDGGDGTPDRGASNEGILKDGAGDTAADTDAPDDMARAREMLMTQAVDLDVMFAELIGKAATELDKWPTAAERFVRLALRAQANCRASLDTVARADRAQQRQRDRDSSATA